MSNPISAAAPEDALLFGAHPGAGLVALEHIADDGPPDRMRLFIRQDGRLETEDEPFQPFLWLTEAALLAGWTGGKASFTELAGDAPLRHLATFASWADLQSAVAHLRKVTGRNPSELDAPYLLIGDPVQQHLMRTGRTLFKGLRFGQLRRLQMDIETYCAAGYDFPNADRESDRIIAISLADESGWVEVLSGADLDEPALIRRWAELVRARDPDVIEGHNLFKFDLAYLLARAKRHRIRLELGRDGSRPSTRPSRVVIADQVIAYPRVEIFGRHVVDTYFLALAYDATHRALDSLTLKDVARHFGVAAPDRTYLDGDEISATFDRDPATLLRYSRDDILETRAVAGILAPPYFTQARMLPFGYQNIAVRGNGVKIDALLLREYLRCGRSVPHPGPARPFEGGYTDLFVSGVVRNVHHCDVRSLYPSLMLARSLGPAADAHGAFLGALRRLRDMRVDAKRRMQAAASEEERSHLDALQTAFKVLINSFYGYLGFAPGRFNDFDAAERVAAGGREVLRGMLDALRAHGATPVESDTDGIYFVPPADDAPEARARFRAAFQAALPPGLEVEFDGEYVSMLSYKMKNYALLDAAGEVTIKGAALKSRGLEPFQRRYLREWLRLTLLEDHAGIRRLQDEFRAAIMERRWPIALLAKTETLQDAPATYAAKIGGKARGRNAAYELALASGRDYRAGDAVSYYVTGTKKSVAVFEAAKLVAQWDPANRDENVPYYLAKLEALIAKFGEASPAQGELFG
jgi:DNA polymerase elongation subunit (family B)